MNTSGRLRPAARVCSRNSSPFKPGSRISRMTRSRSGGRRRQDSSADAKSQNLMAHRTKHGLQSGAHIDVVIGDGEVHGGGVSPSDTAAQVWATSATSLGSGLSALGYASGLRFWGGWDALPCHSPVQPVRRCCRRDPRKTASFYDATGDFEARVSDGAASLLHLCERRRDVVHTDVNDGFSPRPFRMLAGQRRRDSCQHIATRRDRPLESARRRSAEAARPQDQRC